MNNQNCQDAANVSFEWHSAGLTSAINAARNASFVTVGLRQAVESTSGWTGGWKKFDESAGSGGAHLSVTYNTTPVLSNLHTDAAACATSAGSAPALATVGSPAHNPVPQVTVTDGETDKSTVKFTYPAAGGGTTSTSYTNVASGASARLTTGIPAAAGIRSGASR